MNQYPLPEGWRWAKLDQICTVHPGQHILEAYYNREGVGIGYLTGPDDFGKILPLITKWTENPKAWCRPGDILVTVKGAGVGKSNLAPEDKVAIGRQLMAVRPKTDTIDQFFLYNYIVFQLSGLRKKAMGSTVPGLSRRDIENISIPLPPFFEQRRIAAKIQELIQEVERARAACEKQLEAAKALPAGYLRGVFESEEAKKWEKKNLGNICEIIMGQSPPSDSYNKEKLGLPFFQGKADFGGYFPIPQISCSNPIKIAKPNDVLMSVRAPVGPVNLADQVCCIGRGLSALRPNEKLDSWFLFFYFKIIEHKWKGRGSTFDAIRRNDLKNIEIPFLPFSEQRKIAFELREKVIVSENLCSLILNQRSKLDFMAKAILRKAFRGEL